MSTVGEVEGTGVSAMLQMLLEDRQRREAELAEERRRREEELAEERRRRDEELASERARREQEMAEARHRLEEELQVLRSLVEGAQLRREDATTSRKLLMGLDGAKLTKLSDHDDIEAFLTTFERMMTAYEVPMERWAFVLAPQLTGKAQQAYAAMGEADAGKYKKLREAILLRYDINSETYRQRFRQARTKTDESPRQLATRLWDLAQKWLKDCGTVEAMFETVVLEQLLNTLPGDIRVWVRERKPTTSAEAGQLAEDYLQARKGAGTLPQLEPPRKVEEPPMGAPQCHNCGGVGHFARDCRRGAKPRDNGPPRDPVPRPDLRCYNCGKRGHLAMKCPNNALFGQEDQEKGHSSYFAVKAGEGN